MCTKMEVRSLRYKNASLRSNVLPETAKQMNAKVSLITGVTGQVGRRFVDCFIVSLNIRSHSVIFVMKGSDKRCKLFSVGRLNLLKNGVLKQYNSIVPCAIHSRKMLSKHPLNGSLAIYNKSC